MRSKLVDALRLDQDRTTTTKKDSSTPSSSATTAADPFDLAGARLQGIPGSRDEVIAASQEFGEKKLLLLGRDATEAAFKAQGRRSPAGHWPILGSSTLQHMGLRARNSRTGLRSF